MTREQQLPSTACRNDKHDNCIKPDCTCDCHMPPEEKAIRMDQCIFENCTNKPRGCKAPVCACHGGCRYCSEHPAQARTRIWTGNDD